MAKFRNRPTLVDAVQWTGRNIEEIRELAALVVNGQWCVSSQWQEGDTLVIETDASDVANPGDWVVRHPCGKLEAYTPDAFEQQFERVPPSALPWIDAAARGYKPKPG